MEKEFIPSFSCRPVSDFVRIDIIGEGTYGKVYRSVDKRSRTMVALKKITMHNESTNGFPMTSLREISTLRQCSGRNPYIVELLDVTVGPTRDRVYLVFEYCEHDLATLVSQHPLNKPFKEGEVKTLVTQLLSALAHIHLNGIFHRDVKLSNLLYNNKGHLKLCDFGLARNSQISSHGDPLTPNVTTLWYRAPEILLGSTMYTTSVDLWAVGCVGVELALGKPLASGKNELDQLLQLFSVLGAPTERIWPEITSLNLVSSGALDLTLASKTYPFNCLQTLLHPNHCTIEGVRLLNLLLTYDSSRRITAREALKSDYFITSPLPQQESLMPTWPSQHDLSLSDDNRRRIINAMSSPSDSQIQRNKDASLLSSSSSSSSSLRSKRKM